MDTKPCYGEYDSSQHPCETCPHKDGCVKETVNRLTKQPIYRTWKK